MTNIVHTIRTGLFLCLSSPQRPLCVIGRLGTKKKKALMAWWKGERKEARLLPLPSSHCPMSAFCCLIIGIPCGNLCGGESCYVPTLYMCNDRNVMVNSKPGDYLPEWGRYFSVSDTGGSEEKIVYHPVYGVLQLARTLCPILAD